MTIVCNHAHWSDCTSQGMFGRRIGRWSVQGLHYVIGQHCRCKNVSFLCIAKFFVTTFLLYSQQQRLQATGQSITQIPMQCTDNSTTHMYNVHQHISVNLRCNKAKQRSLSVRPVVVSEAKYVQCVNASPHPCVCAEAPLAHFEVHVIISCSSWLYHCGHALVVHDSLLAWTDTLAVSALCWC